MPSSWGSYYPWSDSTDLASNSSHVDSWACQTHQSWSDSVDSHPAIPTVSLKSLQIQSQPIRDSSWSPCPSWSASSRSLSPTWSPFKTWSSSQGSIDDPKQDGDYSPQHNSRPANSPSISITDENIQKSRKSRNIGMSSIQIANPEGLCMI